MTFRSLKGPFRCRKRQCVGLVLGPKLPRPIPSPIDVWLSSLSSLSHPFLMDVAPILVQHCFLKAISHFRRPLCPNTLPGFGIPSPSTCSTSRPLVLRHCCHLNSKLASCMPEVVETAVHPTASTSLLLPLVCQEASLLQAQNRHAPPKVNRIPHSRALLPLTCWSIAQDFKVCFFSYSDST